MAVFDGQGLACQRGVVPVFEGLDFSVASGDALWLAGPNGSGKSSLLRLMAGLLAPVAGAIPGRKDILVAPRAILKGGGPTGRVGTLPSTGTAIQPGP